MAVVSERLNSSWLTRAQYDDETQALTVWTSSGQSYEHPGVPENVYQGLVSATSAGTFWHENIKGVY